MRKPACMWVRLFNDTVSYAFVNDLCVYFFRVEKIHTAYARARCCLVSGWEKYIHYENRTFFVIVMKAINLNTVDILRFHEVNNGEEKEMFI